MAEAAVAVAPPGQRKVVDLKTAAGAPGRGPDEQVTELRVTAHLMTLDQGLFCLVRQPPAMMTSGANGLPGVRISRPPGDDSEVVSISTFRSDGWLGPTDGAALIHVRSPRAQVLVTIYQAPGSRPESAPRLQVLRLTSEPEPAAPPVVPSSPVAAQREPTNTIPQVVAHVQKTGDVGQPFGTWLGVKGSKLWVEGFGISPPDGLQPEDIQYQAVLGKDWMSPWVAAGKFCGSRGMALPLLGIRVRLSEKASRTHTVVYSASFVDGTVVGPVADGEPCDSASLAPVEALNISVDKKPLKPAGKSTTTPKRAR